MHVSLSEKYYREEIPHDSHTSLVGTTKISVSWVCTQFVACMHKFRDLLVLLIIRYFH
jgi:hypothetical protein